MALCGGALRTTSSLSLSSSRHTTASPRQSRRKPAVLHAAASHSAGRQRLWRTVSASPPLRLASCFTGAVLRVKQAKLHNQSTHRASVVRCSAANESLAGDIGAGAAKPQVDAAEASAKLSSTLLLGSLFGLWYLFNIFFNIYNKQVLKAFPAPLTCTTLQFAVGAALAGTAWITGLQKRPVITQETLMSILPLAVVHTLGNTLTNVSLGKVAVSFTHTIKSLEPFFSVLLSSAFLGEVPQLPVVLSLIPIVAGVSLASVSEVSFNWAGFLSAMGANVTFQSRNVLSKKLMGKKKGGLDNINLFSVITIMSFFLLLPFSIAAEGFVTPATLAAKASGLDVSLVLKRALIAAVCFHSYQQVSYLILSRVSPVTHSVGNCVKRVIVIVTSVLFFRTPVSTLNGIGTALALAGVFLYSNVKRMFPVKKLQAA
eukprot:jgi/Chlat1/9120/Chrsp97S08384